MKKFLVLAFAPMVGIGLPVFAQMHKVAPPEVVVRAVGVYEWTGDRAKPAASRLIPVSIFIDGKLEDAGVYLARPVPMALDSGTIYEVDRAGVPEGTLDLRYASHLNASGSGSTDEAINFDDGWFAYGVYAPPPPPKKLVTLRESKTPSQIVSSKPDTSKPESDRPTFSKRPDATSTDKTQATSAAGSGSGAATKPGDTSSASTDAGTTRNDDDPDRPHLTRKPEPATPAESDPTQTSTDTKKSTGTVPADDPDRPTLKKRSPEEAKKAKRESQESSAVGLATSLNDDPNRPTLHRGKGQQAVTEAEFPKLKGVPSNLQQAVAVSDAKTRPMHDFSRPWADDTEKTAILAKLQQMARAQVAAYRGKAGSFSTSTPSPTSSSTASLAPSKRTPNSKLRRAKGNDTVPESEPLFDEDLRGYTLSYGGAATYVYTARTNGEAATLIYVTVVAQMDALGTLQPVIQNVTDAAHLDRTPWMRLVDVVDAEASNRASLLFELREKDSRQFALYRVIAARSEQTFLTGTTQ